MSNLDLRKICKKLKCENEVWSELVGLQLRTLERDLLPIRRLLELRIFCLENPLGTLSVLLVSTVL